MAHLVTSIAKTPPWRPEIIAHRAQGLGHWQNSLPAFRAAVAAGVDAIELDVRLTADAVPVVAHDPDVRMGGHLYTIAAVPYATVARRTPRLEVALDTIGPYVTVDVEIKPQTAALDAVWPLVRKRANVRLSSFDWAILAACRRHAPQCPRGLLVPRDATLTAALSAAATLKATALHLSLRQAQRTWVAAAQAAGLKVRVYTANTPASWRRLAQLRVDAVFTDRPLELAAWLAAS